MALGKLIRRERSIYVFKKTKSSLRPNEKQVISIDSIPFEVIKSIIKPKEDDPELGYNYSLSQRQLEKLNKYIDPKITPDHKKFDYIVETYGIYENEG